MAHPIVHFEIPTDDLARGKAFYETVFGWRIEPYAMPDGTTYYSVYTRSGPEGKSGDGINGGMMLRKDKEQPFTVYATVDSIEETMKTVTENGGNVAMPRTEIAPGMGWIGAFFDTERNLIGLHEVPPEMKTKE
jgi:predicted enzyme related to lactoylglutathione lyase